MEIPITYQEFKRGTGALNDPNKRGSKIKKIDDAFKVYERHFDGANLDQKIQLTLDLFVACKDWLKSKSTKPDVKKQILREPKLNELLLRRRQKIKDLADACLDALQDMDPDFLAEAHFNKRKIRALAQGAHWHKAKHLASGYENERKSWLRSNKSHAFSGTALHPVVKSLYKKKKFDELSIKDYEKISVQQKVSKVRYIRKQDRFQYMAEVDEDGLFCYPSGLKLHCGVEIKDRPEDMAEKYFEIQKYLWMYAMDSYGNLMARSEEKYSSLKKDGLGYFNHSSFHAGREVICAGLILFQNGKLRWIDNNSGHYKPSPEHLRTCVSLLFGDEADLTEACVGNMVFDGHGELAGVDVWRAGTYLSGAKEPDIGRLD